jgi:hypothetical protein
MRKRSTLRTPFAALPLLSVIALLGAQAARGSETPLIASSELSNELVDQARGDVTRVQVLVKEGSLPRASLQDAELRLADIHDQATLTVTLYSSAKLADITDGQQAQMLAAAQRRLERQAGIVNERQKLLVMGAIAKAEMSSVNAELETRQHVLDLARDRVRLIEAQRQMAQEEQNLERALESGTSRKAMLKFEGSGHFRQRDFPAIAAEFEQQFHYPLPVTARGETHLHQAFGLDHRGKIDVGLNPEEPEGIWLRRLLEDRQIPYIAFRMAVPGAATAPHVHIGTGSSRIGLAQR